MKTKQSKRDLQKQFDSKVKELMTIGQNLPPSKPRPEDLRFRKALKKAMALEQELAPALNGIYRHITDVLQNETDKELFRLYPILQMGSTLSSWSPSKLIKTDLVFGDYLKLYTTWAKKAEKLLKAMEKDEPITEPAIIPKSQKKAVTVAGKAGE